MRRSQSAADSRDNSNIAVPLIAAARLSSSATVPAVEGRVSPAARAGAHPRAPLLATRRGSAQVTPRVADDAPGAAATPPPRVGRNNVPVDYFWFARDPGSASEAASWMG